MIRFCEARTAEVFGVVPAIWSDVSVKRVEDPLGPPLRDRRIKLTVPQLMGCVLSVAVCAAGYWRVSDSCGNPSRRRRGIDFEPHRHGAASAGAVKEASL
jgi:hypothetical protein